MFSKILEKIKKEPFYLIVFVFILVVGFLSAFKFLAGDQVLVIDNQNNNNVSTESVSNSNYQSSREPYLSIQSSNGSGALIEQTVFSEPVVEVRGYNFEKNQKAEISVFQLDETQFLKFLLHDNKNNRLNANPDLAGWEPMHTSSANIDDKDATRFVLPLNGSGLWLVRAKAGDKTADTLLSRTETGVVVKNSRDEFIFWGQDLKTKRSVSEGAVKLYNLQDDAKLIGQATFASEGIAKTGFVANADVAIVTRGADVSVIPIGLRYIDSGFLETGWSNQQIKTKNFVFTDRPIYKPGDTVNFKSIIRSDDDATYSIDASPVVVKIFQGYSSEENKIFEQTFGVSESGSVNGEYKLPDSAKPNDYYLTVSRANQSGEDASSTYFSVNLYRKPEYSLNMDASSQELISGEKTKLSISGEYFFGEKMANQEIKYSVSKLDFSDFDYLNDHLRFSNIQEDLTNYWYGTPIENRSGRLRTDAEGSGNFEFEAKNITDKGRDQMVSIQAEVDDGSGNPAVARKNILVHAGEFNIYRRESRSGGQVNQEYTLPLTLQKNFDNAKIDNMSLIAKVERSNWVTNPNSSGKQAQFTEEKEKLPNLKAVSDQDGNLTFQFTPNKVGSYTFTIEAKDARGNFVSRDFHAYITDRETYFTVNNSAISVTLDKELYLPGEKAQLNIASNEGNRDFLFTMERANVRSYQVVKMEGKSATLEIETNDSDIPNVFAEAMSFNTTDLDENQENIVVSAESKKLTVEIQTKSGDFGPGEEASIKVLTKDFQGKPLSAEVALWAVDKSLFELSSTNLGDIFNTYWSERWNATNSSNSLAGIYEAGGKGCFVAGTKVLVSGFKEKNIEEIKVGDKVLSFNPQTSTTELAKVIALHQTNVSGYLVINNSLKVTDSHILNINGNWIKAGQVKIGDQLVDRDGRKITIDSIYWLKDNSSVYNLEVEKNHTYYANGFLVHNGKGEGDSRSIFKDTAYWNPSVKTDENGEATVNFKLPDNLTTWSIAAVGATNNTIVGQNIKDIVVKKSFIVRPVLPNILRVGDSINLRALAHNFTDKTVEAFATLTANDLNVGSPQTKTISLKPNLKNIFDWKVKADKETEINIVTDLVGQDKTKLDSVTQKITVRPFEFTEQKAFAGIGNQSYEIPITKDALNPKTTVTVNLSASSTGSLSSAMKYLLHYPYGCSEQTASALLPTVIAKANPKLFSSSLEGVNTDDIVSKSLRDLNWYQQNGLWSWWKDQKVNYYVSSYIVDVLTQAQKAGFSPDAKMMANVKSATANEYLDLKIEQRVLNNYMQALVGGEIKTKVTDYDKLTTDLLAINVMANYLSGDKNAQTNGLAKLISLAKSQGDASYWEAGTDENFGSIDASTALAVRAILLTGSESDLARRAVTYLVRNRKSDYWSNTYASSQVIMALTENAKVNKELDPDYKYTVKLNGEVVREGEISGLNQSYSFDLPAEKLKGGAQKLTVNKTGEGELYSVVVVKLNRTDRGAGQDSNILTLNRSYELENGHANVGDTVKVNFKVEGLKAEELYAVIKDELPAGLVPIDESLDNEDYDTTDKITDGVFRKEKTENGMILSLWNIKPGLNNYSYRARVVASGSFIAPPADIALMYAPEINARTGVQTVKISESGNLTFTGQNFSDVIRSNSLTLTVLFVLLLIGLAIYFYIKNRQK